jgi:putative glutamine amidotransferase
VRILLAHSDARPFEVERYGAVWEAAGGERDELVPVTPATATGWVDRGVEAAGLLLTGGPDVEPWRYGQAPLAGVELHPDAARDALDLGLLARADESGWPVLAVCYGCQLLAVARGGALIQDLPAAGISGHAIHRPLDHLAHRVQMLGPRLLSWMPSEFAVNSRHHQAIADPGRLRVVGRSPDGVIEAVEDDAAGRFVVGVQWHPENLLIEPHLELFRRFRAACGRPG